MSILVLKKCKKPDDVLFINAAEDYVKGKRQNTLSEENKRQIIGTYQNGAEAPRYSRRVEMAEIEKNDFNLNICRYISTAVGEEEIDLAANFKKLEAIEAEIREATMEHNGFLKELGRPLLPGRRRSEGKTGHLLRNGGETLLEGAVWWRKLWVCFPEGALLSRGGARCASFAPGYLL